MKNVKLSAALELIEKARVVARSQRKALNAAFREWLHKVYFAGRQRSREFDVLMSRLKRVEAGRHFSREEMNER